MALVPARKSSPKDRVTVVDILWILMYASTAVYLMIVFDDLLYRVGVAPENLDILFGIIAILFLMEVTRRTCGPVLPIMSLIFITYALLGNYLPGVFEKLTVSRFIVIFIAAVAMFILGLFDDVIEHRIVPGMFLHDVAHGSDFVRVEKGLKVTLRLENRRQGGGHTHEFMGNDDR